MSDPRTDAIINMTDVIEMGRLPSGLQVDVQTDGLRFIWCPRCGFSLGDIELDMVAEVKSFHAMGCDSVPAKGG